MCSPAGLGVLIPRALLAKSVHMWEKVTVKRVAREKALGWVSMKVNTGRPALARASESVSIQEKK